MNFTFTILMISLFLCYKNNCHSSELGQGNAGHEFQNTSDGHTRKTLHLEYNYNRRNIIWPYKDEKDIAWNWGLMFDHHKVNANFSELTGKKATALLSRKFSKNAYLKGSFIHHQIERQDSEVFFKDTRHGYELTATCVSDDLGHASLTYADDYIYPLMILPAGISQQLSAKILTINTLFTRIKKIRLHVQGKFLQYSDDNKAINMDNDIKYHVSSLGNWFWMGLGINYISNNQKSYEYWTPNKFISYGPRMDISRQLYKSLSSAVALNINRQKENQFSWGNGYYLNMFLQYGDRNNFHSKLGYERIESRQSLSKWTSNKYFIELIGYLP